jgi:hypothetical protein
VGPARVEAVAGGVEVHGQQNRVEPALPPVGMRLL